MTTTIEIPSFDFTGFYYPQILEALIEFKRVNVPELTDESPQEPATQFLRAFALATHLSNVLTDLVANESTLPTAQLVETVRNMLRLIDYEMASASPGQVDMVLVLAQVLASTVQVVPANGQVGTVGTADDPARIFEIIDGLTLARTDEWGYVLAQEGGAFADITATVNGGGSFVPWATPAGGDINGSGDAIYFAHTLAMMDAIVLATVNTAASGFEGVWEYYSGETRKAAPDSLVVSSPQITFDLTTYLGSDPKPGTPIRVELRETGAFEDVFSDYVGGVNIAVTGLLGQTTPSVTPGDYYVGSEWEEFANVVDGTEDTGQPLAQAGTVSWTLPENIDRSWNLATVDGKTARWLRFRITTSAAATGPDLAGMTIGGTQYAKVNATQGETATETGGFATSTPGGTVLLSREHFIDKSQTVVIDGVTWTEVDSFLESTGTDRHYTVTLEGDNDQGQINFGNGVSGQIPPTGSGNISITYRYGANDDGNVGANTVIRDRSGFVYFDRVYNPRPAVGWAPAEGSTDESLAQAKIAGPASLRTRDVALGPNDIESLAVRAHTIDSSVINVSRAFAIEEGFGPKTIELVIVAAGGGLASQEQLDALSEFFNGNQFSTPVKPKRLVSNQEVTAVNYVPRSIDVTAEVETTGTLAAEQVENQLAEVLQPEALAADGVEYRWVRGQVIPNDRLAHEIYSIDPNIIPDVNISVPVGDVQLLSRELPVPGTFNITITEV